MAEISREESRTTIKKWLGCNSCDTDECLSSICVDCKNHYEEDDLRQALDKSLSDMDKIEKLEKIEQIINEYSFAEQYAYQTLDSIEQILRGGEE